MTAPGGVEVAVQRRRLATMLAINALCVLIAAGAVVGVFAYHVQGLIWLFAAALVVGFSAHVWLVLGVARGAASKGSV